jgi:hypothetical protein
VASICRPLLKKKQRCRLCLSFACFDWYGIIRSFFNKKRIKKMLSSSSSQDFLMKIARGADVSETIPSGIEGITWTFDGFREKKTENENTVGWAIRRTEKHYTDMPEGTPPDMLLFMGALVKPTKTIVKWANGNADLYHHIFSNYLDYKYEFDGRVPVPENETEILSVVCEYPASNMPEQLNFNVVVKPSKEPTDVVLTCLDSKNEIVAQYPLWENLTGTENVTAHQQVLELAPGVYAATVKATNQFGEIELTEQFTVLPGIGRELTTYEVPFMGVKNVYIDPSASVNGDGNSPETPHNSWNSVLNLGGSNNYLQKRGTTEIMPGSGFRNINGPCFIGAYGPETDPRPIIKSTLANSTFISTNYQITIKDIEIAGDPSLREGTGIRIRGGAGSIVYNCIVHDWEQCIITQPINSVNGNFWGGVKVLYSTIYGANLDGIYFDDTTDIEVAHCHFYDINMYWFTNQNENNSVGDCLQASCAGTKLNLNVHHCTFDRTSTCNKFCVIYGDSLQTAQGTFRYNHFKMPMDWANPTHPVTGIYIDYTESSQIFEYNIFNGGNYGIYERIKEYGLHVFRYNLFTDNNISINLSTSNGGEVRIENNTFVSWQVGAILTNGGPSVYVLNNLFMLSDAYVYMSPVFSEVKISDYNHFYYTLIWNNVSPPFATVEECRLAGYELHSTEGYPGLMEINPLVPNYMPAAGSPLIGTGQIISGVTRDFAGNIIEAPNSKGLYDVPVINS